MLNYILPLQDERFEVTNASFSENRSFLFGDGFFETIRLNNKGIMPLAGYHAARIARSAALLQFPGIHSFSSHDLHTLFHRIPGSEDWKGMKLKLIFFRQGKGGFAPEAYCKTMVFASASDLRLPFISRIESVSVAESLRIFPSEFAGIKSTSALPYVMAGMERKRKACDEIILLSPDGFVVEGSFTSICWKDDDGIHFTPRELGGIDSVSRRFLEDFFGSAPVSFSEKRITPGELLKNSHWICFSSALGLRFFTPQAGHDFLPEIFAGAGMDDL
jgi:branched-subunit amino acid aminotransferase/4-amino-4-deoxychorismate lyase